MDSSRFDIIIQRLATRRGALVLVSGLLALGVEAALAKRDQHKGRSQTNDRRKRQQQEKSGQRREDAPTQMGGSADDAAPPQAEGARRCRRRCRRKHQHKPARRRCRRRCHRPVPLCQTSADCGACERCESGLCLWSCQSNELCEDGQCVAGCTPPLVRCDRQCVDVATDVLNCGECGRACQPGEACAAGACAATCLAPVSGHADGTDGLQTAIENASGDSLQLCAGTWTLSTNVAITKTFSLIGAGADQTVLDGNDQTHILTVAPGMDVQVTDIAFTRGFSPDFSFLGGAITIAGRLSLTNCELTDNNGDVGGAIYSDGPSGAEQLTVTACTFSGNSAPFAAGGAIAVIDSSLTLTDSVLIDNLSGSFGGGVHVDNRNALGASTQFTDVTFQSNRAGVYGGGLFVSRSHAQLNGVIFQSNRAEFGGGAALYGGHDVTPPRILSLAGCTLDGNTATDLGGGLFVFHSTVTLTSSCSVTGNIAPAGGGGALDADGSQVTLESGITISGNTPPECTGATIIDPGGACNAP